MMQMLGGGLFGAMWNNFYNSLVRNVNPAVRGAIIGIGFIIVAVCLISAIKKGDEKKPIKNWFAFWVAIFTLILLIIYTILCCL